MVYHARDFNNLIMTESGIARPSDLIPKIQNGIPADEVWEIAYRLGLISRPQGPRQVDTDLLGRMCFRCAPYAEMEATGFRIGEHYLPLHMGPHFMRHPYHRMFIHPERFTPRRGDLK